MLEPQTRPRLSLGANRPAQARTAQRRALAVEALPWEDAPAASSEPRSARRRLPRLTNENAREVGPQDTATHARLKNWARWARDGAAPMRVSPMFASTYRSMSFQWHEPEHRTPVDERDAERVERAVAALHEPMRSVVRWAYLYPDAPARRYAQAQGWALDTLVRYLQDGRAIVRRTLNL